MRKLSKLLLQHTSRENNFHARTAFCCVAGENFSVTPILTLLHWKCSLPTESTAPDRLR